MVAQEVLDLLAAAAPDDPEKVQDALEYRRVSNFLAQGCRNWKRSSLWGMLDSYTTNFLLNADETMCLGNQPFGEIRSSSRSRCSSGRTSNNSDRSQKAKQGRKLNHIEG
jgi:hypothetical protein